MRANYFTNVDFINNRLNGVRLYGVWTQQCLSRNINITDNFISNATSPQYVFNTGINIINAYNSTVNILRNSILQNISNPINHVGTGIRVALALPGSVNLDIGNNPAITRVQTGISLIYLQGKNNVNVHDNTITFTRPNSFYTLNSVHYGIRLESCNTVRVRYNNVSKLAQNPTAAMQQNLRGISIENSPVTLVSHNTFLKMGSGIYGYAISSQSTLACNTLNKCYSGVYFSGTTQTGNACDIGDQVVDPYLSNTFDATGNNWIPYFCQGPYQIDGSVNPPITWYWDGTAPTTNSTSNVIIPTTSQSPNACQLFFMASPVVLQRNMEVGEVISSINPNSMSPEQVYLMKRSAYRKLSQHPTWLNLSTTDDTMYQNFYAVNNPANIGSFQQAELNADTGNVQNVLSICNSISCSSLIEQNLKTVYLIYAATWMSGQFSFTPADSTTLLNIALQNPVEGGDGVYSTRVMLDLPVDYFGSNSQRISNVENSIGDSSSSAIRIYPNPASEKVNLEIGIEEGQKGDVEIFNLDGKLIMTNQLEPQQMVYVIDTHSLPAGVYLLRVNVNGEAIESKQLVIIK